MFLFFENLDEDKRTLKVKEHMLYKCEVSSVFFYEVQVVLGLDSDITFFKQRITGNNSK